MRFNMRLIVRVESDKEAIKTFGKTVYKEDTKLVRDMTKFIIYGHRFVESEIFDQL